jgi:hypothetical protein
MKTNIEMLTVKDSEGILRPRAGIWNNDDYGRMDADDFIRKNKDCSIVLVVITEK